jgi:acyl CoA:acetate/3-ketoacid CoA transferase beta subunit
MTHDISDYVVTLAREMRDGDLIHVGADQPNVWLAARLARELWAPSLRVIAGCTYRLQSSLDDAPARTYARDLVATSPGTFQQARVFDDLGRARVSFAGALQVDARGNGNLVGVSDGKGGLKLAGPGSGGLPGLTGFAQRFFIALTEHSRRTLVPTVDFCSVLGDPASRSASGLPPDALCGVITPLATFRMSPDGLFPDQLAPNVTVDELTERTGFPLHLRESMVVRDPIRDDERQTLQILRARGSGVTDA